MKTLSQHNAEQLKRYEEIYQFQQPHSNGIECPKCGRELWDSDPTSTLTSNPPQMNVHCPACGWRGYRYK